MSVVFNPFTGTFDFTGSAGGGGGTPGSPDTAVQYNSSGSFAGNADLTWLPLATTDAVGGLALGTRRAGQLTVPFGGDFSTPDVYIGSDPSLFTPAIASVYLSGDQTMIAFFGSSVNRYSNLQAVIETTDDGEVGIQAISVTQGNAVSPVVGLSASAGNTGTFTIPRADGFRVDGKIYGSGGITLGSGVTALGVAYNSTGRFVTFSGFRVDDWLQLATTHNYGFHSLLSSGSGRYAVYAEGTAPSHFGGAVDVPAGGLTVGAGTLALANNFTTSGNFAVTQTYTNTTSVTFPTSGTLATTSQLPSAAALSKGDDTNVTLTLAGTPATALLQAASITAGWTGTLAVSRGGSGAATLTGLVVGNGTSAMTTVTAPSGTVVGTTDTQTLTNKRITKRVTTAADATSITPNSDTADVTYQANTQAAGTLTINADGGTPTNGQSWLLKVKCTNAQTFSWNTIFAGGAIPLPTVTSGSSLIDYFAFLYDAVTPKWDYTGTATGF